MHFVFQYKVKINLNQFKSFCVNFCFIIFIHKCAAQNVPGACICVPTGACNMAGNPNNPGNGGDGTGQIVSRS